MPDPIFADVRLARLYDAFDGVRADLDVYAAIARELGATSVLDIGCGTGTLALLLSDLGLEVTGADPAAASLDVAQSKPGAAGVRWVPASATELPAAAADLATMTGNVAQVFLTDDEWCEVLAAANRSLRPGGHLVFETRRPERRAWDAWTPELTTATIDISGLGPVTSWVEVTDDSPPLVSFRWRFDFAATGETVESDSTLRFRERDEVERSLEAAGFDVVDVRDAPDRPGLEHVFIARRRS